MIDFKKIENNIGIGQPSSSIVNNILDRASLIKGLSIEDAAALLSVEDPAILQKIFKLAGYVKERVFGSRIILFAPLYLSNYCSNNCLYCGFRSGNKDAVRKVLTVEETIQEARTLEAMGFKRILLVCGEDPDISGIEYITKAVDSIYKHTGIRIVHVNAPPMEIYDLKRLKKSGVGVYQIFQETYHIPTYEVMHPTGKKKNYDYRLAVMDRAIEAGFEDVGIGSLLGLYDYIYDTLATIAHSQYLYEKFGSHAHTISAPRLRPASGSTLKTVPHPVSDEEFKKIIAVYRLSVPSAGIVVSTREGAELRNEVISIGASQLSAGSKTEPGGYTEDRGKAVEQFSTNDNRGLEEIITAIVQNGFLPSFCTTCYRVGRTGANFTQKTLSGDMEKFCQANAILSLQEYLLDYAQNGIKELGIKTIQKGIEKIIEPRLKAVVLKKLGEIIQGKRDVYL